MGAVLVVCGSHGNVSPEDTVETIAERSPWRGPLRERFKVGDACVAVQARGREASIARQGTLVTALYGFIGNWEEIFETRGGVDAAGSDAERLLAAWERLGERTIHLLRGEFALAVVDGNAGKLLLARDAVGCRSLSWAATAMGFVAAPDPLQVLTATKAGAELNDRRIVDYLIRNWVETEESFVGHVREILPGSTYRLALNSRKYVPERALYWSPGPFESHRIREAEPAEVRATLEKAVARSMPTSSVDVTLSGGLDSGAVFALATRLSLEPNRTSKAPTHGRPRAYSLIFPGMPSCDETAYVRNWTSGDGVEIDATFTPESENGAAFERALQTVPYLTAHFSDILAREANAHGSSCLLTGHGGDHWFDRAAPAQQSRSGYFQRLVNLGSKHEWRTVARTVQATLKARLRRKIPESPWLSPVWRAYEKAAVARHVLGPPADGGPSDYGSLLRRLFLERCGFSLRTWEAAAEGNGIEFRHPLMDRDLIELAFRTPPPRGATLSKPRLRDATAGLLPDRISQRAEKPHFTEAVLADANRILGSVPPPNDWRLSRAGIVDSKALGRSLARFEHLSTEKALALLCVSLVERFACQLASSRENRLRP